VLCDECGGEAFCGCTCVLGVMETWPAESGRVQVDEITICVYESEPEVRDDRGLRFEAQVADGHAVRACGRTVAEAIARVLAERAHEDPV
jgi:hypothetical protein